ERRCLCAKASSCELIRPPAHRLYRLLRRPSDPTRRVRFLSTSVRGVPSSRASTPAWPKVTCCVRDRPRPGSICFARSSPARRTRRWCTVSAADLAAGISAVVDLRTWSFVNPDLTIALWRVPQLPWILLAAETHVGDQGIGVARGLLSDHAGPFGACELALIFERGR